ncbi:MAG TPA: hypothetical protein VHD90_00260 [Phototrophicaceae bacterium]|nr:hypothetical protein [Phototrophicaceae bacterium]
MNLLQHVLVKRIERIYRLRLLYGIHLAIYGTVVVFSMLCTTTSQWQSASLLLMLWLPVLVVHTVAQSWYEHHERRMSYALVPVKPFNRYTVPVQLYDENGQPMRGDHDHIDYLPPPR